MNTDEGKWHICWHPHCIAIGSNLRTTRKFSGYRSATSSLGIVLQHSKCTRKTSDRLQGFQSGKQEGRKQVESWDASKRFFLLSLLPAFLFFALRISHAFPAADGGAGMPHEFEFLVPAPGRARSSAVFLLFFFFPN